MMWRRHAQKISIAEEAIFKDLVKRGLNRYLSTQEGFDFDADEIEGEKVK